MGGQGHLWFRQFSETYLSCCLAAFFISSSPLSISRFQTACYSVDLTLVGTEP
jgi:hypothetical protein